MRIPELVIIEQPTPSEVQYLEERIYEFNSSATSITDGRWLAAFVKDDNLRIVVGTCRRTGLDISQNIT